MDTRLVFFEQVECILFASRTVDLLKTSHSESVQQIEMIKKETREYMSGNHKQIRYLISGTESLVGKMMFEKHALICNTKKYRQMRASFFFRIIQSRTNQMR